MDINTHILSTFNDDLGSIKKQLEQLVSSVETSLGNAMEGLKSADLSLCNLVIADDDQIDDTHRMIESLAMGTLVRYNPMASDLRFVVSSIGIAKNLERIGDHTVEIASNTKKIYKNDVMTVDLEYVNDLYQTAVSQFLLAKTAILQADIKAAQSCIDANETMRKVSKKISKIFVKMMNNEEQGISTYLRLVMIARSLERISSISSNIAEEIIYIETAENVRSRDL